jgi:hypothetical protein
MARKRFISPEFFHHSELYDAEEVTRLPLRLAFAGLWCQADRRGVFVWKPRELKVACLPYDTVDFDAVLSALESHGFVRRYVVDGKPLGMIPSFSRWQTFHRDERPSNLPMPGRTDADSGARDAVTPCQHGANTVVAPCDSGSSTPVTVTATVTATTTGTVAVAVAREESVVEANPDHRVLLTTAANQGITEQFGEQPVPLRWDQKGTFATAAQLEAAAVPLPFARQQLYELARTRCPSDGKPPRTMSYYAGAIVDAWRAEEVHRVTATHPVLIPSDRTSSLTWDLMIARAEEAARVA